MSKVIQQYMDKYWKICSQVADLENELEYLQANVEKGNGDEDVRSVHGLFTVGLDIHITTNELITLVESRIITLSDTKLEMQCNLDEMEKVILGGKNV